MLKIKNILKLITTAAILSTSCLASVGIITNYSIDQSLLKFYGDVEDFQIKDTYSKFYDYVDKNHTILKNKFLGNDYQNSKVTINCRNLGTTYQKNRSKASTDFTMTFDVVPRQFISYQNAPYMKITTPRIHNKSIDSVKIGDSDEGIKNIINKMFLSVTQSNVNFIDKNIANILHGGLSYANNPTTVNNAAKTPANWTWDWKEMFRINQDTCVNKFDTFFGSLFQFSQCYNPNNSDNGTYSNSKTTYQPKLNSYWYDKGFRYNLTPLSLNIQEIENKNTWPELYNGYFSSVFQLGQYEYPMAGGVNINDWVYNFLNFYKGEQLDTRAQTYDLTNLFTITNAGYDNGIDSEKVGYYFDFGINKKYLLAAENEMLNDSANEKWANEVHYYNNEKYNPQDPNSKKYIYDEKYINDSEKVRWINSQYVPNDFLNKLSWSSRFSEISSLISKRIIAYDNYEIVRQYYDDFCKNSKQIPPLGWLESSIKSKPSLWNNSRSKYSMQYGFDKAGGNKIYEKLALILPYLKYTGSYSTNNSPSNPSLNSWTNFQFFENLPSFDFNDLYNKKRVYLNLSNNIGFKAKCDIVDANQEKTIKVDNWNFDLKNTIDSNVTASEIDTNFWYDNTLRLVNDTVDKIDTYWQFDSKIKKLTNMFDDGRKLEISDQINIGRVPSEIWNSIQGNSKAEKLSALFVSENNKPTCPFQWKITSPLGEYYDSKLDDNILDVVCDDDNGQMKIRLINGDEIEDEIIISGFRQESIGSNIQLKFVTNMTLYNKTEYDTIYGILFYPLETDWKVTFSFNTNLLNIRFLDSDMLSFTINARNQNIVTNESGTTVKILVRDSGGYIVDQTSFNVIVLDGTDPYVPINPIDPTPDDNENDVLSAWTIVGIATGSVLGLTAICGGTYTMKQITNKNTKKKKRKNK